jgi:hypothetical protein
MVLISNITSTPLHFFRAVHKWQGKLFKEVIIMAVETQEANLDILNQRSVYLAFFYLAIVQNWLGLQAMFSHLAALL